MKRFPIKSLVFCSSLFLVSTAQAHDPSEHHGGEAPDCEAMHKEMKGMKDMDKMDPVMMAMMKQCESDHDGKGHEHEDGGDDDHHGKKHHHDDD